eukprot:TRINITY_DN2078_c0_g1_i6.p1 TRINITY_DN2078_c0_g1~~TRINITY_DN2078_c0_g1_i6.p1  ORF type:complete len:236 (+),score=-24.79 TRINITY_DN2078_c0_g1_i6:31-738(+)
MQNPTMTHPNATCSMICLRIRMLNECQAKSIYNQKNILYRFVTYYTWITQYYCLVQYNNVKIDTWQPAKTQQYEKLTKGRSSSCQGNQTSSRERASPQHKNHSLCMHIHGKIVLLYDQTNSIMLTNINLVGVNITSIISPLQSHACISYQHLGKDSKHTRVQKAIIKQEKKYKKDKTIVQMCKASMLLTTESYTLFFVLKENLKVYRIISKVDFKTFLTSQQRIPRPILTKLSTK